MEFKTFDLDVIERIASELKEEAKKNFEEQYYFLYAMAINDFVTSIKVECSEETFNGLIQIITERYNKIDLPTEVLEYLASELLKKHSIEEIESMNKIQFDKEINKAYKKYSRSC